MKAPLLLFALIARRIVPSSVLVWSLFLGSWIFAQPQTAITPSDRIATRLNVG